MARVTEYVGADSVESSPADRGRMTHARPGDLIEWADGTLGRVWTVEDGFVEHGELHVCRELGSAFLHHHEPGGTVGVDISGGPFLVLKLEELQPALRMSTARFWNWGDNSRGADHGVDYWLARPVFKVNRIP